MATLQKLELDLPTSEPLISAPLADSFPNLTSLIVKSSEESGFRKNLMHMLPKGLVELEIGGRIVCPQLDLRIFENLRAVRIGDIINWDIFACMPDTLEELRVTTQVTSNLAISKLPSKLRVLDVKGPHLTLVFDAKAPSTIEELSLDLERQPLCPWTDLLPIFEMQKIKKLSLSFVGILSEASQWEHLPNLEHVGTRLIDFHVFDPELLPRKLKTLEGSMISLTADIPPSLEELWCGIFDAEDVAMLPRTIRKLNLFSEEDTKSPPAAWRALPPYLKQLNVPLVLFASAKCFDVLPKTLESLTIEYSPDEHRRHSDKIIDTLSFSKALQNSLLTLSIRNPNPREPVPSIAHKLTSFSRLSTLHIGAKILITSDTLSLLPQTIKEIRFDCFDLYNHGLPSHEDRETSDWKNGAFSNLPKNLERLNVNHEDSMIDMMVFSRLPARLALLAVSAEFAWRFDAERLYSALPRRIAGLDITFTSVYSVALDEGLLVWLLWRRRRKRRRGHDG